MYLAGLLLISSNLWIALPPHDRTIHRYVGVNARQTRWSTVQSNGAGILRGDGARESLRSVLNILHNYIPAVPDSIAPACFLVSRRAIRFGLESHLARRYVPA
jgi:hypothetical protein